jgi:hypothetical protein
MENVVKRFDLNPHDGECGLEEDATGEWVRYEDHRRYTKALKIAIDFLKINSFESVLLQIEKELAPK